MKIVLSRKGFDSQAGGIPSPILPDNTLLSLPIPTHGNTSFRDAKYNGCSLESILYQLNSGRIRSGGFWRTLDASRSCHIDPDLGLYDIPRNPKWKPALGQIGSAASHLRGKAVGVGDLFLFFGWFKRVKLHKQKWNYDDQALDIHAIFGYLDVGKVITASGDWPEALSYHPHTSECYSLHPLNTLYIAADQLTFDKRLPGASTLSYCSAVQLTKPHHKRSHWILPDCLREVSITYHSNSSWTNEYFQAAARGQEFVIEATKDVQEWALSMIQNGINGIGARQFV